MSGSYLNVPLSKAIVNALKEICRSRLQEKMYRHLLYSPVLLQKNDTFHMLRMKKCLLSYALSEQEHN